MAPPDRCLELIQVHLRPSIGRADDVEGILLVSEDRQRSLEDYAATN